MDEKTDVLSESGTSVNNDILKITISDTNLYGIEKKNPNVNAFNKNPISTEAGNINHNIQNINENITDIQIKNPINKNKPWRKVIRRSIG